MSLPTSLLAYEDCRGVYNAAANDPKGARVCLGTYESCVGMRTRMHYFRKLDRVANLEVYPKGHHMHGASTFDAFVVQIIKDEDDQFWLYVQPRSAKILHIEGLSEVGGLMDVDGEEAHDPS
jgi:hypothetical protein